MSNDTPANDLELISLSELIEQVKADLLSEVKKPREEPPLLFIDEIEITAQVVAKREESDGNKGKLKLSVLGLGAGAELSEQTKVAQERTQSVKIKLTPLLAKEAYLQSLDNEQRVKIGMQAKKSVVRGGGSKGGGRETA